MRYHPSIGYTYMPSAKLRVQTSNGGYLVRTNAAGFRSEREFIQNRAPGAFRALFFGDSQTAGDGGANALRFSDLLETSLPGLETFNYALSGTGTDQHYLTYRENRAVDHDLVVVCVYTENIRRLTSRIIRSNDINGEVIFRSKPYFTLSDRSGIDLCNVPVPKQTYTEQTLPAELLPFVYAFGQEHSYFRKPESSYATLLKKLAPSGPMRRSLKAMATRVRKFQPLPEYDSAKSPQWLLMREILATWIAESRVPVMVLLIHHETALKKLSDPSRCQERFRELARDTGCHLYDPLPELMQYDDETRAALWSDANWHLSPRGHEAIARLVAPRIRAFME